jgi:hypothetical protein
VITENAICGFVLILKICEIVFLRYSFSGEEHQKSLHERVHYHLYIMALKRLFPFVVNNVVIYFKENPTADIVLLLANKNIIVSVNAYNTTS